MDGKAHAEGAHGFWRGMVAGLSIEVGGGLFKRAVSGNPSSTSMSVGYPGEEARLGIHALDGCNGILRPESTCPNQKRPAEKGLKCQKVFQPLGCPSLGCPSPTPGVCAKHGTRSTSRSIASPPGVCHPRGAQFLRAAAGIRRPWAAGNFLGGKTLNFLLKAHRCVCVCRFLATPQKKKRRRRRRSRRSRRRRRNTPATRKHMSSVPCTFCFP